jgi:Raf kinase inhibitor-like YbhB/YbcL family protein
MRQHVHAEATVPQSPVVDCERAVKRLLIVGVLGVTAGCGSSDTARSSSTASAPPAAGFALRSAGFKAGARVPQRYTCDGANARPPLSFTKPPRGTKSLAIAVEDPDAPGGTFVHWTAVGIPASTRVVPVKGIVNGRNGAGGVGWTGPCPPAGKPHRYVFRLFALDAKPVLPAGFSRSAFDQAVGRHLIAETRLTGLYSR